jgi:hypothetical protein
MIFFYMKTMTEHRPLKANIMTLK